MGGDGGGRIASGGNPGGFLRIYASTQGQGNSQFYLTGLSTYIGKRINIDLKDIATSSVYTAWYTTSFGAYISNWVNSTSPSVWTTYSTIIPASADILYIDVEGYDVDSFCGVDNLVITD
jgi:hypothetical protein